MAMKISQEENVSPWEAMLKSVRLAAGRVSWVDAQLEQIVNANDGDLDAPQVRRWLDESRKERALLARMSKVAVDAGLAERMVRQVELEGQLVAEAVVYALDTLDLSSEQRAQALEAAHAKLLTQGGPQTTVIQGNVLYDDRTPNPHSDDRPRYDDQTNDDDEDDERK